MKTETDESLLLQFFLTFSKFEYSLKNSGFCKQPSKTNVEAKPDWDLFAGEVRDIFDADALELKIAVDYILLNPPFREVIVSGDLSWDATSLPDTMPKVDQLLTYARRIRNNLFHGAEFSSVQNSRTDDIYALIRATLVLLQAFVNLLPNVKSTYEKATL